MHRAYAQERLGRLPEALATAQRMKQLDAAPDFVAFLGFVHGRIGHRDEAQQALEELRMMSQSRRVSPMFFALIAVGLGENGRAIEHLRQLVEEYPSSVIGSLKVDPHWDNLRSDPRFVALIEKAGKQN